MSVYKKKGGRNVDTITKREKGLDRKGISGN